MTAEAQTLGSIAATAIHQIRAQGREFGCDKCKEIQPGFLRYTQTYFLSEPKYVAGMIAANQFCDCQTGTNLHVAALRRCKVDEGDIARLQSQRAQKNEIERLFPDNGFPPDLAGMTIKTWSDYFGEDPHKQLAKRALIELGSKGFIKSDQGQWPGLLLFGTAGTGKTGGMVPILKKWKDEDKRSTLFITLNDILLLTNWQDDKRAERERIAMLGRVPCLGIDELVMPGQGISDHERSRIIFPIIDQRHKRRLPTIITTNCELKELASKLGQMTYERLLSLCAPIELGGESGRKIVDHVHWQDKLGG